MTTRTEYAQKLAIQSRESHKGVFITGPSEIQLLEDDLPKNVFTGDHVVSYSLGNCRCASDGKAIKQFHQHARVPNDATQVALGHETLQVIVEAPESTGLTAGDIVFITPGHSALPVNPASFELDNENGVLPSLGYSYRNFGGLRPFNAIPVSAIDFVKSQGFGNLFNAVPANDETSIVSLAHSEPFACNYGTNKFIFTTADNGDFIYGVPPRAKIAYLAGTARMAMINLTIVASVPPEELPSVVYITGSQAKLDELDHFDLIKRLRAAGTKVVLIDRRDPNIIDKLQSEGKPEIIWTNFATTDVYAQACAIIATGGNINNYAGAADPELVLQIHIDAATNYASLEEEAETVIAGMHHNVHPNNPERHYGLAKEAVVLLDGFASDKRSATYRAACNGATVYTCYDTVPEGTQFTDVFIAGTGTEAAKRYSTRELQLARNAAVAFVDGDCDIAIRSKHSHYTSRHQLCGSNVPWAMTNTSEPHADDMALQGQNPVNFDWMVKGVCGLNHTLAMMDDVEASAPFGSFYVFTDLADLPWVAVSAADFRKAAETANEIVATALKAAADELASNGDVWSRRVEEILFESFGKAYPLTLS